VHAVLVTFLAALALLGVLALLLLRGGDRERTSNSLSQSSLQRNRLRLVPVTNRPPRSLDDLRRARLAGRAPPDLSRSSGMGPPGPWDSSSA
jgi:hypothetical protein